MPEKMGSFIAVQLVRRRRIMDAMEMQYGAGFRRFESTARNFAMRAVEVF